MPLIYHITTENDWNNAKGEGLYIAPSLKDEGLIHCCEQEQISDILTKYYKDNLDVMLLTIDTRLLRSQLVYEWSPSLEAIFPHIYGPINTDCVIAAKKP
jgi:uncharacterized protein (DUF952 family)